MKYEDRVEELRRDKIREEYLNFKIVSVENRGCNFEVNFHECEEGIIYHADENIHDQLADNQAQEILDKAYEQYNQFG